MSEAELHVLRARLEGGIRNKATRGELRKALPIGLVWGEEEGEILIDPDEAIRGAIQTIFDRFAELGRCGKCGSGCDARTCGSRCGAGRPSSAGSPRLSPDPQRARKPGVCRRVRVREDPPGAIRRRARQPAPAVPSAPPSRMGCLIWDHHPGFIDKATFERNRPARQQHPPAGARARRRRARGAGIAARNRRVRPLRTQAQGALSRPPRAQEPRLSLSRQHPGQNRGEWCVRVGGGQIDQAVTGALLAALTRSGVKAALPAAKRSSKTTTPR